MPHFTLIFFLKKKKKTKNYNYNYNFFQKKTWKPTIFLKVFDGRLKISLKNTIFKSVYWII